MSSYQISNSEKSALWSNGWVVLKNFISDDLINLLDQEAKSLQENIPEGKFPTSVTNEDGKLLVMNSLDNKSEFIFDLCRDKMFIDAAEMLCGKAVVPIHAEMFSKPQPGTPPTPPHQDQIFYEEHFDDEIAITFWCPLDNVSHGDGALEYAKTTENRLLPHRLSDSIDFGKEIIDSSGFQFEPVYLEKGDVVIHHAYTIHRSGRIENSRPRRAFAFNFRTSSFIEGRRKNNFDEL